MDFFVTEFNEKIPNNSSVTRLPIMIFEIKDCWLKNFATVRNCKKILKFIKKAIDSILEMELFVRIIQITINWADPAYRTADKRNICHAEKPSDAAIIPKASPILGKPKTVGKESFIPFRKPIVRFKKSYAHRLMINRSQIIFV